MPEFLASNWIIPLFTGVIAVATIIYVVFTIFLWRETRKSADAALLNAKVASQQMAALIASERAWIDGEFIKHEVIGVVRYSLKVTNQGKTPAQIFGYDIWHGLLTEGVEFSREKLTTHFSESKYVFIAGGATMTLRDDFDIDDLFTLDSGVAAKAEGIQKGAFCVVIKYGDVLSERQEHETSFVYFYDLFFSTIVRIAEQNKYT
jgi:hypothetical protein